ncbi:S-layer homology domain-containing protein [Domibacillus robiginosus]|uniref:S-layer homology domain-containing protein n=1 Tax=Domibacillus robiginosus TaxID=1071054 RepID=UPI00067CE708|nr:S-layer homology domain-containing protein [Domibacillus robiginosus]
MKKFIAVPLAFILLVSALFSSHASAAVSVFNDISPNHRAYEAVWSLSAKKVFEPKDDDFMVRPAKQVSRMEAAVMIARILGLKRETNHPGFRDVTVLNQNYNEVAALAERGILQGFKDRTMRPNDILTRSQMAKLLVDAFEYERKTSFSLPFKDVKRDNWAAPYVEALVRNNITAGTTATTFSPDKKLTRSELMMLLYRAHKKKPISEYNDQEVLGFIREVQNKPYMILEAYKYSQKTRPAFSTFKKEITPYAEGAMLSAMQEFYEVSCTQCDWLLYSDVDDNGLPYVIHEKTSNKIKVTVRAPHGLNEAVTETWTIVNRNGQWKLSEWVDSRTTREEPFNLTVQQAQAWIMYAFDIPKGESGLREYVKEIQYMGKNRDGTYRFRVKTNTHQSFYTVDPADGTIEDEQR